MRQRINGIRTSEGGFTLIELLITVVILGVLAGIVVFAVGNFDDEGVQAACKADKKNVEVASEAYRAQKGSYATAIGAAGDTTTLVGAGYLREAPSSTKYTINYNATGGVVTGSIC